MAPDGFETATATDRGWFISPELTYGVRIPMQDYTLTPRARVRYVAGFFDAFSEQGSAQNLSIASRTVQDVEERSSWRCRGSTRGPGSDRSRPR